jgi:hypothetical protein
MRHDCSVCGGTGWIPVLIQNVRVGVRYCGCRPNVGPDGKPMRFPDAHAIAWELDTIFCEEARRASMSRDDRWRRLPDDVRQMFEETFSRICHKRHRLGVHVPEDCPLCVFVHHCTCCRDGR